MTYRLIQLAPGAYDLLLNGEVMGSVVRNGSLQPYTWTAELLEDVPRSRRTQLLSSKSNKTSQLWKSSALGLARQR